MSCYPAALSLWSKSMLRRTVDRDQPEEAGGVTKRSRAVDAGIDTAICGLKGSVNILGVQVKIVLTYCTNRPIKLIG